MKLLPDLLLVAALVNFDTGIAFQASAGRNKLADNDVFLQTHERIDLSANRGFGQYAGGFLEGSGSEEALGSKRSLGDAKQDALGGCRTFILCDRFTVGTACG